MIPAPSTPSRRRSPLVIALVVLLAAGALLALAGLPRGVAVPLPGLPGATNPSEVHILAADAATLDPARQGDVSSAAIAAQLFETLTTFDASLTLRPALAESWAVGSGGTHVVFMLRPGLTFSDGSPLTATDVAESWLRVLDPATQAPLASLLDDVSGAAAYRLGRSRDRGSVGIRAVDDRHVEVDLDRPASDLVSIVSSPTFAVVPASVRNGDDAALTSARFVGSGGYVLSARTPIELTLTANPRYWAGEPAITTVHLVTSIAGRSPVDAFTSGDLDYAPISDTDAAWIAYDRTLGPQLRTVPSLATTYYGFDTSRPPFDDARMRRAVAEAVDWARIVTLADVGGEVPATSMIPNGIPGRPSASSVPAFDPADARRQLASAGHADGGSVGPITMLTSGGLYDAAVAAQLRANLGLDVRVETTDFDAYQQRLTADPPAMWSMSWIADYPGPNDFLGVLLGSDASNNYGRWRSTAFDQAIDAAGRGTDPSAAAAAYARALSIVRDEVPVIPVSTGTGWALSRTGLLGAAQNGLGIVRMAGLAWNR